MLEAEGFSEAFAGLLDDGLEGAHIGDCELGEHLSVELDALGVESVDQLAVLDVAVRASSGDSDDPEAPEIALFGSSVSEGVLPRLHDLLVSTSENVLLSPEVTLGLANDLLVALVAHEATLNSCHSLSPV